MRDLKAVGLCLLLGVVSQAFGQAPSVNVVRPTGVQPGQTIDLRTIGGNLAGAKECWTSFAGVVPLAADIEKNGTDNGQCVFRMTVPPDAPLGVHAVRVATERGVSSLRLMLVDDLPTVAEAGGNNAITSPQEVAVPVGIDGQVDNLSRDFYRFTANAGQTLTLEVWARRLGSPLDPVIFLYAADGRELAYADDSPGLSSDCQLVHTFAETSQYIVEVRDVQYRGDGNHAYRLRIGDFPALNIPVPSGVQRNVSSRIDFTGLQGNEAAPVQLTVPADRPDQWTRVATTRVGGTQHAFGVVQVSEGAEVLEREPNDAPEQANQIELGSGINGRADQPGDVDRFSFKAAKDQKLDFRGMTRELGSPMDLSLQILKPDGGQLAAADDAGTEEGTLSVTFPEEAVYTLEVRDLERRGGSAFGYRIQVTTRNPSVRLEAGTDAITLPQGNVVAVPVSITRIDYGADVRIAAENLPAGVTAVPTVIGPGLNSGVLTLEAVDGFELGKVNSISLTATTKVGDAESRTTATTRGSLRGLWNNTVVFPGTLESSIALAGRPPQKIRVRVEPQQLQFKRGEKPTVKLTVTRGEGIDEQVTFATNPDKNAFPANVNLGLAPIPKGQNEVSLAFDSNDKSPVGTFTVVLTATCKQGNETMVVSVPGITYTIAE